MNPRHLALAIAVVFALLIFYGLVAQEADRSAALRRKYLKLVRLSKAEGEAQLAERLESLSRRFPGKTYRWYLSWLVNDLERAKR
ncbi:MAG: hypothetical protein IPJ65_33060 [Archangiaceae bacterium]|nr:hypothetical protein [Archangiaceae bacterium]